MPIHESLGIRVKNDILGVTIKMKPKNLMHKNICSSSALGSTLTDFCLYFLADMCDVINDHK